MKRLLILAALTLGMATAIVAVETARECVKRKTFMGQCIKWRHKTCVKQEKGICKVWEYWEDGYAVRTCQGPCSVVLKRWGKTAVCNAKGKTQCIARVRAPKKARKQLDKAQQEADQKLLNRYASVIVA